tara:strand:- start:45 stop:860 length:816 start_codon:yes stop_codon:yes gene_type:complete
MKLLKNNLDYNNYYSDTDYISNSMLNHISVSPEYFRFRQDNPQPATPAMKLGSAIHMDILQPGEFLNHYAISPKFDKRTKKGKEDFAEFTKNNMFKTVISESDYELITEISLKVFKDSLVKDLLKNGEPEKIIQWNNKNYDVNCKGMLDYYRKSADMIVDLKTTQDASYNGFMRSVIKYKYHKQAAFYLDAVQATRFIIIAVEKTPPFSINVFELGDDMIDGGRDMYNHELEIYKYCEENDYWPGAGFDPLDKKSERTIHILGNYDEVHEI